MLLKYFSMRFGHVDLYVDVVHGVHNYLVISNNIDNCFFLILMFSRVTIDVVLGVGCVLGVVSVIELKSPRFMNVGCWGGPLSNLKDCEKSSKLIALSIVAPYLLP